MAARFGANVDFGILGYLDNISDAVGVAVWS